jgi:hypothetical protein
MTFNYILSGAVPTSSSIQALAVDVFDTPQTTIDALKAQGVKVICYFSAGSYEDWREDASRFPAAYLGKNLDGWPGEKWLDIRGIDSPSNPIRAIMLDRIALAKAKRCDAVDPDNVDGYLQDSGFTMTDSDQIAYLTFLSSSAHAQGLKIGLKNALDLIPRVVSMFDFSLNEQCYYFQECDLLIPFIQQNKAVFIVEYVAWTTVQKKCANAVANKFTLIRKNLDLTATPYNAC